MSFTKLKDMLEYNRQKIIALLNFSIKAKHSFFKAMRKF